MQRLLGVFFCVIVAIAGTSQQPDNELFFDHLTISDGLSHNTVHCLLQDRYGYIWAGTQHGLNKYDGYNFEVVRSLNEEEENLGLFGAKITALYEDRKGNLWVGTSKNGIYYRPVHNDRFISLNQDSAYIFIADHEITSFLEDREGQIWITTIEGGLLQYTPSDGTTRHYTQANSGLSSDVVFDIKEDKYGTIWVATAGGGLNILGADHRFQLSHPMLPNHPNMSGYRKKLLLDDEYLWVATEGTGLYRMDTRDRTYLHFAPGLETRSLSSNGVRDICKMPDGTVFIATDGGGLNIYSPDTEEITEYRYQVKNKTGLNSDALYCIEKDRTGNIWIGTYNGGINIYKPWKVWFRQFAPGMTGSKTLYNRSILALAQNHDSVVWIGSDGGGLNRLTPEHSQFIIPPFRHQPNDKRSIAGNVVKALFEDSRNRLWVGLFGAGLDRYKPESQTFEHILGPPYSVWSITERQNGELWAGTMGEGIVVLNPETLETDYLRHDPSNPKSLADLNVMAVYADQSDQVWVGTIDQGLDRWVESRKEFEHFRYNPEDPYSISNNAIRSIFEDSQGNIWIGTEGGGLNQWLGDGRFKRIGQSEGLVANSVMGITEDEVGMIWVTTFEGISRLDPETMDIQNFDFRTHQNANQFNQSALLAANDGRLFFGGTNGLNTIQTSQLNTEAFAGTVILTDFKIFNQTIKAGQTLDGRVILERPIEEAEHIQLSYLDKSFSFSFSAIDYTNPKDYQYAFIMQGFDEQWQETEAGQNRVSYTNLDPGDYTFKVKYQEQMASINVHIQPPFWQTSWFRVLMALSIICLAAIGIYLILKRKEAVHNRALLRLKNEKMAAEIEAKTSKLMFSTVQMAHKNEMLTGLKDDLLKLQQQSGAPLGGVVRKLDAELRNEDHWKDFDIYFNQVDQDFFQSLLAKHPALTQNDLRLCSLIRINLSTKEIAFLLNISTRAVEQGRYRLKKRLELGKEEDLNKYITGFKTTD